MLSSLYPHNKDADSAGNASVDDLDVKSSAKGGSTATSHMTELPRSMRRSQDDLPSEFKECQGDCKNGTFFLLYAESDEFLLEAVSAVQHSGQIWEAWNLGKAADGAE